VISVAVEQNVKYKGVPPEERSGEKPLVFMHLAFYFKMVIAIWEGDHEGGEDGERIRWRPSTV